MGNRFLHSLMTLRTRGHCFLSHSFLGEGVSYAYDLGKVGRVIEKFSVPGLVANYCSKCLSWFAIILSAWLRGPDELYPQYEGAGAYSAGARPCSPKTSTCRKY